MITKLHNVQAIFMETVLQLKKKKHTFIECYGIDEQRAAQAPAYFRVQKITLLREIEMNYISFLFMI
jgi:hypothetical protein